MDRLLDAGEDPDMPVAVVYHASWPDQDVLTGTIADIAETVDQAGYESSALVLIGEAVTGGEYERSHLYGGWATDDPPEEPGGQP
jgi:precorrin-4/cobalt-precorrin-4 C11-methyltransferase